MPRNKRSPFELTPAARGKIAAMAVRGRPYRKIAAAFRISPKAINAIRDEGLRRARRDPRRYAACRAYLRAHGAPS